MGNFEFVTNNDYLELRERTMWGVFWIPYMFWLYNIIYEPVMLTWCLFSLGYITLAAITMQIKAWRYELWEDPEHPMQWNNFLERHMTHYVYDI